MSVVMRLAHGWRDALALFGPGLSTYIHLNKQTNAANTLQTPDSPRKGIIMNVARSFNNWRKYRQTVSELGRMSNRDLHDLGIDRADIQRVAREAVAR